MNDNTQLSLGEKLIKIREAVSYIKKTKKGQNNTYVPVSEVLAKVIPLMNDNGILLYTSISNGKTTYDTRIEKSEFKGKIEEKTKFNYYVDADLTYTFFDTITKETLIVPFYTTAKNISDPAQALGSGVTYSKRYFLYEFFNIAMDELDPDSFIQKYDLDDNIDEKIEAVRDAESKIRILLSEYKGADKSAIQADCVAKRENGKFTVEFAEKTAKKLGGSL